MQHGESFRSAAPPDCRILCDKQLIFDDVAERRKRGLQLGCTQYCDETINGKGFNYGAAVDKLQQEEYQEDFDFDQVRRLMTVDEDTINPRTNMG